MSSVRDAISMSVTPFREQASIHVLDFYRPQTKLREGNVITRVCYSDHGDMMSLPIWFHVPSRGGYDDTSCWFHVPSRRGYGLWSREWGMVYPVPLVLTSSGGHRSGRYPSYWNAFSKFDQNLIKFVSFKHTNLGCST